MRRPSVARRTPQLASMRSLWSRLTAGAMTVVGASAYNAASKTADFTWALATGIRYSMPRSRCPPPMSTGGVPWCVRTSAPISRSGPATRSIGRFMSDASPISCESKDCADSRPVNQPHRRAGIAHVERTAGIAQAVQPHAADHDPGRSGLFDLHAQRAHRGQGRQAVLARQKPGDFAGAPRNAGQHEGAVRNGFVARNHRRSRHAARRLRREFARAGRHPRQSTACGYEPST